MSKTTIFTLFTICLLALGALQVNAKPKSVDTFPDMQALQDFERLLQQADAPEAVIDNLFESGEFIELDPTDNKNEDGSDDGDAGENPGETEVIIPGEEEELEEEETFPGEEEIGFPGEEEEVEEEESFPGEEEIALPGEEEEEEAVEEVEEEEEVVTNPIEEIELELEIPEENPAEEIENPTEEIEIENPAEEIENPTEEIENPSENENPSEEIENPSETENPSEEIENPSEEIENPNEETESELPPLEDIIIDLGLHLAVKPGSEFHLDLDLDVNKNGNVTHEVKSVGVGKDDVTYHQHPENTNLRPNHGN